MIQTEQGTVYGQRFLRKDIGVAIVVLIALDQVNVGGDIVRESFLIILAGIVFALALAFGLGGKDAAAELIDRWWPGRGKKDDS